MTTILFSLLRRSKIAHQRDEVIKKGRLVSLGCICVSYTCEGIWGVRISRWGICIGFDSYSLSAIGVVLIICYCMIVELNL